MPGRRSKSRRARRSRRSRKTRRVRGGRSCPVCRDRCMPVSSGTKGGDTFNDGSYRCIRCHSYC